MAVVVTPLSGSEKLCFREVSIHGLISELESFVMRDEYLNKVEDNASNEFQELRDIWAQWDDEAKQLFYQNYGDLPYLLDIKVDKHLLRAMGYKAYVRPASLPTFTKKLVMIIGMSEQWVVARVQQKGDSRCILWAVLRDLISTYPDVKKRVDVLALSIYGMVIFPKVLGHIDEAVTDLFDRLGKQNTPMPAILAETIRSLSACQRAGEGRFIGCAQLLLVWFHSHFWKLDKVPCRVFFEGYSPLKEAVDMPRRDDISEERWIDILQNLREEDVPLPGIWEVVGYTPLLVLRRVNDNVPRPILGVARSLEESLRVIPSELEVMKQKFERKSSELEKKMEKLEEEKMCLTHDVDVQKIEVEKNYRDLPYLLDAKVDRHLFRAMVQFWNPSYSCFTFSDVDLVPTYSCFTTLLCCSRIQGHKAYVRPASLPTFTKKLNTPVPAILAETIRSLNACQGAGEGRFIGCAQLLVEAVDMPRREDISEERWIDILQNLREEDVMWKAPWLVPSEVLYRCGSFDWVPLPGIWGVVGYTPFLVLRQYRARQFIPATQGLAQSDFSYKGDHYKKRMREISKAWKKPFCMKILTEGLTSTLKYKGWFCRRVNDNVLRPTLGVA
ncbi:hypothetical protein CXB51_034611 [Gossypium anomalum]|uniref:DUF7745 domain-containing protein n=1 Tax=Gossypium anomalum TaxID=47600 RepID=A0A8J5Y1C1_9ROSI|nr:hypothetical protein CXB51_034611 [Gossypium anomalum]